MTGMDAFLAGIPTPSVTRYQGIITAASPGSKVLVVNINGNTVPARYASNATLAVGDTVAVDLVGGQGGGSEAWVIGRLTSAPLPATGAVKTVPPSSPTVTVTGTDGTDYTVTFASSYTPTVNDLVELYWGASQGFIIAKVGAVPAPPPTAAPPAPVTAPPPLMPSGTNAFRATDTSTWRSAGGWDSWAGGGAVYQGDGGGGALTGAWFYAGSPAQLAGRNITAVRLTLPARNTAGTPGSAVTVNLCTHTSAARGTGNVTLGSASTTVTALPFQGSVVLNLPTSFAADLLAGGGIAITGGSYAGFAGRTQQPDSGLLSIDWTR